MLSILPCQSSRALRRAAFTLLALALPSLPARAQKTIHVPADQPTIQAGINTATNGDTVLVAPGTYTENIDFTGKALSVLSSDGPANTILHNASDTAAAVTFQTQESRTASLQGFTITSTSSAGAIAISKSSPTISGNVLVGTRCVPISASYASPLIRNNQITGTTAKGACGGQDISAISLQSNDARMPSLPAEIIGNTITGNSFVGTGGSAIATALSRANVIGNRITHNSASGSGAALYAGGAEGLFFANNILAANSSLYGSAVYLFTYGSGEVRAAFVNNTVVDNIQAAGTNAASQLTISAFLGVVNNSLLLANNIMRASSATPLVGCFNTADALNPNLTYGNSTRLTHNLLFNAGSGPVFNSVCQGVAHDRKDIVGEASFVDRVGEDFHLAAGSAGIDSGIMSVVGIAAANFGYGFNQDLDGRPRVTSTTSFPAVIDLGAYESGTGTNDPGTMFTLATDPLSLAAGPIQAGTPVTMVVTATNSSVVPQGFITLIHNEGPSPNALPLDATGKAIFTTAPLSAGIHSFYVGCSICNTGSAYFNESVILTLLVQGSGKATSIAVVSSRNPAQRGYGALLTATVTAPVATPTGNVTFSEGQTTFGAAPLNSAGVATLTLPATLSRGAHTILVSYTGDGTASPASTTYTQTITGASSSSVLTASATQAPANTPITLTAETTEADHSTPDLTKLQILDGTTPLAPLATNGTRVTTTVTLSPGTHTLTAVFAGDSNLEPSTSAPVTVTVQGAPSTLALSTTPVQPLAFQSFTTHVAVTASGTTPRGTVALTVDGKAAASFATVDAAAAGTALNLPAGTYTLAATFSPTDNNSLASAATASLVVSRAPVSLTLGTPLPPPFPQSQPATLTAVLDDGTGRHLATGSIGLVVDGAAFAPITLPQDGRVSAQLAGLSVGVHTVSFAYLGDANFLPATTASVQVTVLDRDFALQHDAAFTVPAGSYIVRSLSLQSIGDFTGPVSLSCQDLPPAASCRFAQASPSLSASGSATVQFALDTSALPGFQQSAGLAPLFQRPGLVVAAFALPLGLLFRKRLRSLPALLALCVLSATLAAALLGCSGQLPAYTPPGTYTIQIVGQSSTIRHAHTVTLQVTEPHR